MTDKPTVLFVCVHNAGRSQMAVGWLRHLGRWHHRGPFRRQWIRRPGQLGRLEAMREVGIGITDQTSPIDLSDPSVALSRPALAQPTLSAVHVDLTRDSVAAGDDAYAPHRQSPYLPDDASLRDAVSAALARHYLASIAGGKATWLVIADGTVSAVVAEQWAQPRWLVDARMPAPAAIHFRHLAQCDPGEVYDEYFDRR